MNTDLALHEAGQAPGRLSHETARALGITPTIMSQALIDAMGDTRHWEARVRGVLCSFGKGACAQRLGGPGHAAPHLEQLQQLQRLHGVQGAVGHAVHERHEHRVAAGLQHAQRPQAAGRAQAAELAQLQSHGVRGQAPSLQMPGTTTPGTHRMAAVQPARRIASRRCAELAQLPSQLHLHESCDEDSALSWVMLGATMSGIQLLAGSQLARGVAWRQCACEHTALQCSEWLDRHSMHTTRRMPGLHRMGRLVRLTHQSADLLGELLQQGARVVPQLCTRPTDVDQLLCKDAAHGSLYIYTQYF